MLDQYQLIFFVSSLMSTTFAIANSVEVVDATVECNQNSECTFNVTIRHNDSGWDHYANRWEVLTPDGEVIAVRVLHHPHIHEQPFTRSLFQVAVPIDIKRVKIRAHDSVHNYGSEMFSLGLPDR